MMQIDPTKTGNVLGNIGNTAEAGRLEPSQARASGDTHRASSASSAATFSIDESRKLKTVTYGKGEEQGKKASAQDIMDQAGELDAVAMKNEMVIGAKTISSADAEKLEEQGFSLRNTDVHTVVTVTDKIKATLAAAGEDVSKMGGVSDAVLDELSSGSGVMAAITTGMASADLPVTQDAAADVAQQFDAAQRLTRSGALSDEAKAYLIGEELPPTIVNVGQAVSAAASGAVQNMATEALWTVDTMAQAVESVFTREHIAKTPENEEAAEWLLSRELPLTYENITYKKALDDAAIFDPAAPAQEKDAAILTSELEALGESGAAKDAMLAPGYSVEDRAADALRTVESATDDDLAYLIENGEELTLQNLKKAHEVNSLEGASGRGVKASGTDPIALVRAQRILEETRLVMSLEANRTLTQKGMEIDTTELSDLVDHLKQVESDYYKQVLDPKGEVNTSQVESFKGVLEAAEELKRMPAAALSSEGFDGHTLESLHREGALLQKSYEAAGERYETMATEVRRDLGDSIGKAFQNVGDILEDLGYERSEENARAVRILGYNHVEVNTENIERMKKADALVQSAFDSLKPAVVREMIKEGINPLSMDLETLKTKAEEIKRSLPAFDESERFSKYLYRMEQSGEFTEEERSSYIGIYRLMTQVEKTDGAAVGAVVETGREMSLTSLLSAVRTAKKGTMDYTVDDDFGGAEGSIRGESITEQVMKAFGLLNGNGAFTDGDGEQQEHEAQADQKYYEEMLKDMQHAADASEEVYRALEAYEIIPSVDNTIVMEQLMQNPDAGLKRFFTLEREELRDEEDLYAQLEKAKQDILDAFGEHIKHPQELADAMETLASVAEHCGQTYLKDDMTTLDLRQMQLACKQLSVASNLARDFHYNVPVMTQDGVTNVSFRLVQGEESGTVSVYMETEQYGTLSAKLTVQDGETRGYIASDSRAGVDALLARIDELPGSIDVLFAQEVRDQAYSLGDPSDRDTDVGALFDLATEVIRFLRQPF